MSQDFQGRKIIVTGAATGIGRATAEALIAAGASVALWDIDQAACAPLSEKTNAKAIALEVDVASSASVEAAMKKASKPWKTLTERLTMRALGSIHCRSKRLRKPNLTA